MTDLEQLFWNAWQELPDWGPPVCQYPFQKRQSFDFAWPQFRVAVEIQGGLYVRGRHSRGAAQEADLWKLNDAIRSGWAVLQFGPNHLRREMDDVIGMVQAVLSRRYKESRPGPDPIHDAGSL